MIPAYQIENLYYYTPRISRLAPCIMYDLQQEVYPNKQISDSASDIVNRMKYLGITRFEGMTSKFIAYQIYLENGIFKAKVWKA